MKTFRCTWRRLPSDSAVKAPPCFNLVMQVAHRSSDAVSLPRSSARRLLKGSLLALTVAASPLARSEAQYPSAQDLIALVEVVSVECVRVGHLKSEDVDLMRSNLPKLFHRATYAQYLASPSYERSAKAMREDVAKDGVDKKLCEGLRSFGTMKEGEVIFAERGLDYPERPGR